MPETYLSLILKASKTGSGVTDATREMKDFEKSIESVRKTEATAAAQHLRTAEALKSNSGIANVTRQSFAGLEKELQAGSLSAAGFQAATQKAGVSAGLISDASLKASTAIGKLNSDYVTGKVNTDQYAQGLRGIQGELQASQGFMERYGSVVNTVAVVSLAALAMGFADVSKTAMDFEKSMSVIVGLTNTTKEQLGGLTAEVLKMAPAVGKSPEELSKALYFISSSGYQGAEALKILESSAKASAAGLGETKTIADSVTSALNAYGLGADQAGRFTDMFIQIVREGKGEPAELANVLGRGLPIAKAAGISFEELGASIATMTLGGMDSAEAMTSFRGTVSALEAPGKQATDALKSLGLSADDVRKSIRERGLLATLKDLMDRTGGNIETLDMIIPNIRALTGVLSAAGSQAGAYSDILGRMKTTTGQTGEAFAVASETMAFKADQVSASFDTIKISLGNMLLPLLKDLMDTVKGVIDSFIALDPNTQKMIVTFGALALSAAPASVAIDKIITVSKGFSEAARNGELLSKSLGAIKMVEFGVLIAGLTVIITFLQRVSEAAKKSTDDLLKMANSNTGNVLEDTLNRAAASAEILTNGQDRLRVALDGTHQKIKDGADGYADYKSSIEATAKAAGFEIDAMGNLIQVSYGMGGRVEKLVEANYAYTDAQYKGIEASKTAAYGIDLLSGSMLGATAVSKGMSEADRQEVERLKGHVDAVKSLTEATKESTKDTEENKKAQEALGAWYGSMTSSAIAYTDKQEKLSDLQAKLKKLNDDIAAAGPAQVATVQNKTMSESQYAAALAKQVKIQEDLTQGVRKKNETDAEYASRMANLKVQLDNVSTSLGTHAGMIGGVTTEQLKNRDAILEQIKAMQEQDNTARAMEGMKSLEEGLKTGRINLDQYKERVTALNDVTHLFTKEGMDASLAQTAFIQSLSDPNKSLQDIQEAVRNYTTSIQTTIPATSDAAKAAQNYAETVPKAVQDAKNAALEAGPAIGGALKITVPPADTSIFDASMGSAKDKAVITGGDIAASMTSTALPPADTSAFDASMGGVPAKAKQAHDDAATELAKPINVPALDVSAMQAVNAMPAVTMAPLVFPPPDFSAFNASLTTVQTNAATTGAGITTALQPPLAAIAADPNIPLFSQLFNVSMTTAQTDSTNTATTITSTLPPALAALATDPSPANFASLFGTSMSAVIEAAKRAADESGILKRAIDLLESKTITITTVYKTVGEEGGAAPPKPKKGAAAGTNFVVPPGYPNDSYPLLVQSGERVIVMTPEQQRTHGFASGTMSQTSYPWFSGYASWQTTPAFQTESIEAGYSGSAASAIREYRIQQSALSKTAAELTRQMSALNEEEQRNLALLGMSASDMGEMSDEMKALKEEYDATTKAINENTAAHDEAMKKIVLDIAQQQLATDGWAEAEIWAFAEVARNMGMFDEASANLTKNVLKATATLAKDGNIAVFNDKLKRAFGDVSASAIGFAQFGGPISRPTIVGETGPELFFPQSRGYVMDNADSLRLIKALEMLAARSGTESAAPGNTYSLTVNGAGQAPNVLRDFAMLQALAGA